MLIKESDLRQIVKEEILNEFLGLGLFKRGASNQVNQRKKIYLTEQDKKIAAFIVTLKQAKQEIVDPEKPIFNEEDDFALWDYSTKAIDGYNLLDEKIFPILSSFSNVLKENKTKFEKFKYPLHIGYTLYKFFNESDMFDKSKSTISLQKQAKDYFLKLESAERKEIMSLIMFYRRIFVYMKQNDMSEFLVNQFLDLHPGNSSNTTEDKVRSDSKIPSRIAPGKTPSHLIPKNITTARRNMS